MVFMPIVYAEYYGGEFEIMTISFLLRKIFAFKNKIK